MMQSASLEPNASQFSVVCAMTSDDTDALVSEAKVEAKNRAVLVSTSSCVALLSIMVLILSMLWFLPPLFLPPPQQPVPIPDPVQSSEREWDQKE